MEAEQLRDLAGHRAWTSGDVGPVVAQRDDSGASEEVVPVNVLPAILDQMRGPTVEFHRDTEGRVQVVQVCRSRTSLHPGLACRLGQPVRPLDVLHIPEL